MLEAIKSGSRAQIPSRVDLPEPGSAFQYLAVARMANMRSARASEPEKVLPASEQVERQSGLLSLIFRFVGTKSRRGPGRPITTGHGLHPSPIPRKFEEIFLQGCR